MSQISGSIRIFSCGAKICRFDNQTDICDIGHKLGHVGWCQSQSIGKWNSSGFEPTFPVCLIDYKSNLDSSSRVVRVDQQLVSSSKNLNTFEEIVGDSFPIVRSSETLTAVSKETQYDDDIARSFLLSSTSILISSSTGITSQEPGTDGTFNIHQSGKNVVRHDTNTTSDYWIVDTYNEDTVVKYDNQIVSSAPVLGVTRPIFSSYIVGNDINVSRPYGAVTGPVLLPQGYVLASGEVADNPVDICIDDLTPPVVSRCIPDKWSHLNVFSTPVELRVSDSIGGVDIGVLKVTISGNKTSQPHGVLVVSSGVDTTSGHVSITGDINEYIIRYTPPLNWSLGEMVSVVVSGQDAVPLAPGPTPWTCYNPDFRNVFGESYSFYVGDNGDVSATITAVPDNEGPYLYNTYPGMYTRDNDAYTRVSFDVIDDITGVDISELYVGVDGRELIIGGAIQTSEVSVEVLYNGYRISYYPMSRFDYGKSINVVVYSADRYNLSPNYSITQYFFTVVEESSLVISNFEPSADSSCLAETKFISTDVVDTAFGLKDAYFIVNGTTYSGIRTPIYGMSNISTTVSGVTVISGSVVSNGLFTGCNVVGTSISDISIVGGQLSSPVIVSGTITLLNAPLDNINGFTIISGSILESSLVSGTVISPLVSGTNWDGKYVGATLSGVTVSGTALSGVESFGITVSGIFGYNISCHPDNDYKYNDVINVYVHAENGNSLSPVIRNELYRLYYGYRIIEPRYEMRHGQQVYVFARAANTSSLINRLSDIYTFTTCVQPSSDISAVIEPRVPWRDLGVDITINSPTHYYGETITVEFYVEDRGGNSFGPYVFEYTIENE